MQRESDRFKVTFTINLGGGGGGHHLIPGGGG